MTPPTDHLRTLSTRSRAVVACYEAFEQAPGLRPVRPEDEQLRAEVARLRAALRAFDADSEMVRAYGAQTLEPRPELAEAADFLERRAAEHVDAPDYAEGMRAAARLVRELAEVGPR